jgi:2-polyprenyl-3-methyl-5-hydroxy-6-metoxy-1,4-benzoquinol methylase
MGIDSGKLVELNRDQTGSETDTFTEERYRQFERYFTRGTSDVLDVGCNTGRGGDILKSLRPGLSITGLDCVPERLSVLDRNVYQKSICSFTKEISLPNESFDAIVAGEFIEHVPPDEVFQTLCEFFRLLRLKGKLLLTTPNPHYFKNFILKASVLGGSHVSQHTSASLKRRLEDIGFSRIKIRGTGRVSRFLGENFPWRSAYGSYFVKAIKW